MTIKTQDSFTCQLNHIIRISLVVFNIVLQAGHTQRSAAGRWRVAPRKSIKLKTVTCTIAHTILLFIIVKSIASSKNHSYSIKDSYLQ